MDKYRVILADPTGDKGGDFAVESDSRDGAIAAALEQAAESAPSLTEVAEVYRLEP